MKVTAKVKDEALLKMLKDQQARGRDLSPVMKVIAQDMDTRKDMNFREQKDPDGKAWEPLSPVTLHRRRTRKISPTSSTLKLQDKGLLRGSFAIKYTNKSAQIGTNDPKAPTQQFGAKKGQYGRTKRGGPIPWGDVPSRRMIGINPKQKAAYLKRIHNWILRGER